MSDTPTSVTLWHRSNAKNSRWRRIGTAGSFSEAITLGERAGLTGGKWWLDDRTTAPVVEPKGLFDAVPTADGAEVLV